MFKASNIIFIHNQTNHTRNITRHPECYTCLTLCLMTLPANTCELPNVITHNAAYECYCRVSDLAPYCKLPVKFQLKFR